MYQQIFDALKAKFQGVSDSVLSRIATKLAKTVTTAEQVTTAIEGVTIQQVLDSYADSRATEAAQTAVQNYENKYGLKDGAKIKKQTDGEGDDKKNSHKQQGGDDDVPAWVQSLIDSNKQLAERVNRMETERTTTNRKAQLATITNKLPDNLRKPYERLSLDGLTDEQFSTLLTEVTTEVDGIANSLKAKGAVFGRPTATTGGRDDELTEAQIRDIEKRDGVPAADAQLF